MRRKGNNVEIWRGKWAVVTGASSGIGRAIAVELASQGAHLVLTSRRLDRLNELALELQSKYAIQAKTFQADLNDPQAPEKIFAFTKEQNLTVDVLVNNAGLGRYGEFYSSDLAAQLSMVQVHCHALLHLTHLFLGGMVERRSGYILIVATTTLAPAPYLTTYAATKGFDLLFAEGLAEEVARYGVRISALCPGPTASEMVITTDGSTASQHPSLQAAEAVARKGLQGLAEGKRYIRPSLAAWITANAPRLFPRATISGATERVYRPKHLGSVAPVAKGN
jgi:short-subunit dehydrogenase